METVFIGESLIDYNQWTNDNDGLQKLKIGEIFQLNDSRISMCCLNCSQEFQYFTEFTLHVQEHFIRGEIAQLKEIKEEPPTEIENKPDFDDSGSQNEEIEVKCEVAPTDVIDDFFNDDFGSTWSDDGVSGSLMDEQETTTVEKPPENLSIIEGTHYEKLNEKFMCLICDHKATIWNEFKQHMLNHSNTKEVMCPICSKLFASYAYTQKHCSRTHKQKISVDKIKEAQTLRYEKERNLVDRSALQPQPPPPPPSEQTPEFSEQKQHTRPEKRVYVDGIDYKRSNDKFQCLTCNRTMVKLDHMKEHLQTHSNTKNVFCPICARAFITGKPFIQQLIVNIGNGNRRM